MPGEQVTRNGRQREAGKRASSPEVDGAPVPRAPGLLGARSPRCRWSCSRSPSPRSCRSRWCSPTRRCWDVLRPRLLAVPAERCGEATEAIRDPGEADSSPLHPLRCHSKEQENPAGPPPVWRSEQCSAARGRLDGGGVWARMDTGLCGAGSLRRPPETVTLAISQYDIKSFF